MTRDFSKFKRVVVYRIGSLGDTLVVLPAFHLVRRTFPGAHITLLTNIPVHAKAAPMEAVLGGGHFYDDVLRYPVSLRSIEGLFRLRKDLKKGEYDCLVYLASPKGGLLTSIRDYLFFRLCGIRTVLGVPFSRYALQSLPIPGTNLYTSRTSRAIEALSGLGTIEMSDPRAWDLGLTPEEIAESERLLGKHGITLPFLAVAAGTKMTSKDWEEHNWMQLLERLADEYPTLPIVFFGVEEERERSERLMAVWRGPKANFCGLTAPRVAAAVLRSAKVIVCHDSGPMHLAATMGIPCVALFSARAKPGEWFPRGDNHVVIYHMTPCWNCGLEVCIERGKACILSITVDEVFAPVVKQLARRGVMARSEDAKTMGGKGITGGLASGLRILMPERAASGQRGAKSKESGVGRRGERLAIVLVGNYPPDGQQSMQRFVAVMERELNSAGLEVLVVRPEPFFGRLHPGARGLGKFLGYLDKFLVFPGRLRRLVRQFRQRGDGRLLVHVCDHSNAFYVRELGDVPHVVTCHDLIAVRSALGEIPRNPTRFSGRCLQRMILNGLRAAKNVVCVSDATQKDLCRLVPGAESRSSVALMGLNNSFSRVPMEQARARVMELVNGTGRRANPRMRYILHVGDDSWYKNREGVVELFSELRRCAPDEDFWLVTVGKPHGDSLRKMIEERGLQSRVIALSGITHSDLCAAYSAAELLLFPSFEEGFGWPIIEAQACGCPVVTTAKQPMSDIGGPSAVLIDPPDRSTAMQAILNVLYESPAARDARIDAGLTNAARHSTQTMIDSYRRLYDRITGGTP